MVVAQSCIRDAKRDGHRWTQAEVAEISKGEAGQTLWFHSQNTYYSARTNIALCRFFECDVGDLLVRVKDGE